MNLHDIPDAFKSTQHEPPVRTFNIKFVYG